MLAYRHQFHAGNYADVIKHALLVQLLLKIGSKPAPYFCLDTHAGSGRYDLNHKWALKNAEHASGIAILWRQKDRVHPHLRAYLDLVAAENPDGELRQYPGSAWIIRRMLRAADRAVFSELNRKDYETLAALFARDKRVKVVRADGYQTLNALLPPRERRGLIFIDSPFDRPNEFQRLTEALAGAVRKFETGIYAAWYPLMEATTLRRFERSVAAAGIRKVLQIEFSVCPPEWTVTLRGCGMVIINPPFQFKEAATAILDFLFPLLSDGGVAGPRKIEHSIARGRTPRPQVRWLVGE